MSSNNSHLDRRQVLSKMKPPELISIIVGLEHDINLLHQKLDSANDHINEINVNNKKFNARVIREKIELRDSKHSLLDQFKVLYTDMNISLTQNTQSIRYNELRNKLQELSNNQLSSNLSVSSNSNSGCTSKRTFEDLQSGCNGDNNIIYMLSGLVNTLIDQKNI